jgi:hypothetical protein
VVNVRRLDLRRTVTRQITIAQIVSHDHDDIWGTPLANTFPRDIRTLSESGISHPHET